MEQAFKQTLLAWEHAGKELSPEFFASAFHLLPCFPIVPLLHAKGGHGRLTPFTCHFFLADPKKSLAEADGAVSTAGRT